MSTTAENNKRIAKNTLLLYFRMLLTMVVSLYTSRVILQTLGVEDYGIYNVVGGVVTMFTFINSPMVTSTQRYITYALGKGNFDLLRKTFSSAIQIHAIISIIIIILSETVGLWFLYEKLIIPETRMFAALVVYQCSIFSCIATVMSAPYNADIIAHEKMSAFAYISILEVTLKLATVLLLRFLVFDKLMLYAVLILCTHLIIRLVYVIYCNRHFEESKYYHVIEKPLLKEMSSFAGWSLFGSFSVICCNQGTNLLLNTFFGPVVNAARGIALSVESAITSFSYNFQTALRPQIIKTYAVGKLEEHLQLVFMTCKFSACLLMIISLPVILETETILKLWLGEVPEHTVNFIRIILLLSIWDSTAYPLATSIQAIGKIRTYQIVISSTILLVLPISYLTLRYIAIPELASLIHFIIAVFAQIVRLLFLKAYIKLDIFQYINNIYIPIFFALIISLSISYLLFGNSDISNIKLILKIIVCVLMGLITSYLLVLNSKERRFINHIVATTINKMF